MKHLTILTLLFLVNCEPRGSGAKDFVELREKLPTIQTPVSFNSNVEISLKAIDLPDNQILRRLRAKNYFAPFGKLFESDSIIVIIGYVPNDTGTPVIVSIDGHGNEIDSYMVYETAMGDIGYYSWNFVTITPTRRVYLIDSTVTRKINKEGTNEIPGTDSLVVTTKEYRITDRGKIEPVGRHPFFNK